MTINIEKIIVKDRIRKDFGDIQELAEDIKQNGLINPPVVNKEYELLAGERRLRACKSLGWNQIEIRMMDTRDAEHELNVEISENENRKEFSKSERVDYMKRLLRIEQAKNHQGERNDLKETSDKCLSEVDRADERAAKQFDVSRETMRKEMSIVDNKDLLDPSDFTDWDEGKLSTNKVFQKIKFELAEKDRKIKALEIDGKERDDYISTRELYIHELESREPKVIEKKVEVEVIPDDYEELKQREKGHLKDYRNLEKVKDGLLDENKELKARLKELEERKDIKDHQRKLEEEAGYFVMHTLEYIRRSGGYVWITGYIDKLPESQRKEFADAVYAIDAFGKQMVENIGGYGVGRK